MSDSFEHYQSLPGINFSTLKYMAKSPLHYRQAVDVGVEDKRAWELGRVCHTAVLEPFSWMERYVIKPDTVERPGKEGAKTITLRRDKRIPEWRAFQEKAAAENREIIDRADHDIAVEVSRAVMLNEAAANIFRARPQTEVDISWERMGLQLKSRLDIAAPGLCIADLKTTRDITPERTASEIINRDYLAQFAFYADAWHAKTGEAATFCAIFVEKSAPFDVDVIEFSEEDLEEGRERYESWLTKAIECAQANNWPGVGNGNVRKFVRPAWAKRETDTDISDIGVEW